MKGFDTIKTARVPALPLLLGTAAGILLAIADVWAVPAAIAGVVLALVMWRLGRLFLGSIAVGVALGVFMTMPRLPQPLPQQFTHGQVTATLRVDKVYGDAESNRYLATIDTLAGLPTRLPVMVNMLRSSDALRPGTVLTVPVELQQPDPVADLPDQTPEATMLRRLGISAVAFAEGDSISSLAYQPTAAQRFTATAQEHIADAVYAMNCAAPTTAFLLAVIAGDDTTIETAREDAFRATGIAHVLALSGLHVGVIVWLAMLLLTPVFSLRGGRTVGYILLAVTILLYALATGLSASVARAAVMVAVFIFTKLKNRAPSPYNALFFTVFIWLCINPLWIFSAGLQLSAAAVFVIIWLSPIVCPVTMPARLRSILSLVAIPIIALTGTSLLTAYYFHRLPLWFLPVNIVAGLTVPLMVALGAIGCLLTAAGFTTSLLSGTLNGLYAVLDSTAAWFAALPGGVATNIYPHWWQTLAYALALSVMGWGTWRRSRTIAISGALLFVAVFFSLVHTPGRRGPDELHIPRRPHFTEIIIRHDRDAWTITDELFPGQLSNLLARDYLGTRGIDSLTVMADTADVAPGIRRHGPLIDFHGRTILVLNTDDIAYSAPHVDYLLVCKGFTGKIRQAARAVHADTVLLAASLNRRRARRYAAELIADSIAVRMLHDRPFSLTAPATAEKP